MEKGVGGRGGGVGSGRVQRDGLERRIDIIWQESEVVMSVRSLLSSWFITFYAHINLRGASLPWKCPEGLYIIPAQVVRTRLTADNAGRYTNMVNTFATIMRYVMPALYYVPSQLVYLRIYSVSLILSLKPGNNEWSFAMAH